MGRRAKFCTSCGCEFKEGEKFCSQCGAALPQIIMEEPEEKDSEVSQEQQPDVEPDANQNAPDTAKASGRSGKKLRYLLGGLTAAFIACFAGVMTLLFSDREPDYGLSRLEVTANRSAVSHSAGVDLSGRELEPAARDLSGRWDSSLFYWLEETDANSDADGNINQCELIRFQTDRIDTGNRMEYEAYRDASSGEIYKIVSVEHTGQGLELTDYYYQQGKLNFVFRRKDSIYTPSYASIDKAGDRFSFHEDQMTRWRFIDQPQVVKQWILSPDETSYEQRVYSELTDEERAVYDEKEREIFNDGCHTYETVMAHSLAPVLAGRVVDGQGQPVAGAWVGICRTGEDKAFVKLETDERGEYSWEISDPAGSYYLAAQKEGCRTLVMDPETFSSAAAQTVQDDMILLKKGKKKSTVDLQVCGLEPAELLASAEQEQAAASGEEPEDAPMPALEGVRAIFRRGIRRMEGGEAGVFTTDARGMLRAALPQGIYTVELQKDGYETAWIMVTAQEGEAGRTAYCVRNQEQPPVWSIVLTWNNAGGQPLDLDSCMFTPRQSRAGNMEYVSPIHPDDGEGTRFLHDGRGRSTCEVIQIDNPQQGSYKYYVSDYQQAKGETVREDGAAARLFLSGAAVNVYKNGQLVRTFRLPAGEQGSIWEVFEIQNGEVRPIQRLYADAKGKEWWIQDKSTARLRRLAMKAYWEYLEQNIDVVEYESYSDISGVRQFAIHDLDGDGLEELIAYYDLIDTDGLFDGSGITILSYHPGSENPLIPHEFEGQWDKNLLNADDFGLIFNKKEKQIFSVNPPFSHDAMPQYIIGYQYSGDYQWKELKPERSDHEAPDPYDSHFYYLAWNGNYLPDQGMHDFEVEDYSNPADEKAAFDDYVKYCETYVHSDQKLKFVENTLPNREMYLGQEIPTGLVQIKECDREGMRLPGIQSLGKLPEEDTGWQSDSYGNDRRYLYPDGRMACDAWIDEDFYVESDGRMIRDSWKAINGKSYYFGPDGAVQRNSAEFESFIGLYGVLDDGYFVDEEYYDETIPPGAVSDPETFSEICPLTPYVYIERIYNGRVVGSYYDGTTGGGAPENFFDFNVEMRGDGTFSYEHNCGEFTTLNDFQLETKNGRNYVSLKCALRKNAGYETMEDYVKADLDRWEDRWRNHQESYLLIK